MDAPDILRRARERKGFGIAADDIVDQLDLIERLFDLHRARQIGRHEHRPELAADHAAAQPGDIGVVRRRPAVQPAAQIERPARIAFALAQRLGPVIMAIDQRGLAQDPGDAGVIILRAGHTRHSHSCHPRRSHRRRHYRPSPGQPARHQ